MRFQGLDGLRGLAVLMVLLAHTVMLDPQDAFSAGLVSAAHAGWLGVDLFFVLSGFLITDILLRSKGSANYLRAFFGRRALRILPLCYLTLAFLFILAPLLPLAKAEVYAGLAQHQGWFWTHLSNIHFARGGFTGDPTDVYWSLAVEEQFYLIWPFVIMVTGLKTLRRLCLGLIIAAPLIRFAGVFAGVRPDALYALTVMRMDTLAWGALLACQMRTGDGLTHWLARLRWAGVLSLLLIAAIAWGRGGVDFLDPVVQLFVYTLGAVSFAALVAQAILGCRATLWVFDRVGWRILGKYSFAIYLLHMPIRSILWNFGLSVERLAFGDSLWLGQILFSTTVIGATLLAAWGSWCLIESPMMRLKRYLPYRPNPGPTSPVPPPPSASAAYGS